MTDRTELLEAALDSLTEGLALADQDGRVALWNRAAETITGIRERRSGGPQRARDAGPDGGRRRTTWIRQADAEKAARARIAGAAAAQGWARKSRWWRGCSRCATAWAARIGAGVVFHPAESMDALPHGELGEDSRVGESQMELEDRLAAMHEDFLRSDIAAGRAVGDGGPGARIAANPRGAGLRNDAGKGGAHAGAGLRPAKRSGAGATMNSWSCRTSAVRRCLRRTRRLWRDWRAPTDFRWWGDRVSLTVSIGAAQAERGETAGADCWSGRRPRC